MMQDEESDFSESEEEEEERGGAHCNCWGGRRARGSPRPLVLTLPVAARRGSSGRHGWLPLRQLHQQLASAFCWRQRIYCTGSCLDPLPPSL